MSEQKPDSTETEAPESERRAFLLKAAAAAVGVGVLGQLVEAGEAVAGPAPAAAAAKSTYSFDSNIPPAALTPENIKKITDRIAAQLAAEAKSGAEMGAAGFHIKVGGGHSRVFSKTGDHKNVGHSEVIIVVDGP